MKKLLVFFTLFSIFKTKAVQASDTFPQLDISTYPEQIFWFLIIFALLYLFISKYAIPRIKTIQNSRERLIKQNITNNNKNISEIAKIKNLIDLQLSNAHTESKRNINKVTQELLHIEDKRINELKAENDKIKIANYQNNLLVEKEFFIDFQANVKDVALTMLNKLEINLPEQYVNEVITKNRNISKVDKHE